MADQFCLKWNNYQLSLTSAFKHLLEEEDFVDVTLSAEGKNLKAHKVVLSACSQYFRDLLRGISLWQHPVLVLRDVPFLDLQSILEFVYLGEVNVEQDRLQSFLKTAELLRIKGLTDGLPDSGGGKPPAEDPGPRGQEQEARRQEQEARRCSPKKEEQVVVPSLLRPTTKRPSSVTDEILNGVNLLPPEKKLKIVEETDKDEAQLTESEHGDDYDGEILDYEDDEDDEDYSGEHIVVAGDAITQQATIEDYDDENRLKIVDDNEVLAVSPLHKRCLHCNMVMLKKNLSRHTRDQHTEERPRSQCPICQKSYKTPDWLKDHIRRGHGYTKEATDSLMDKLKLKPMNPHRLKNNNTSTVTANCSVLTLTN